MSPSTTASTLASTVSTSSHRFASNHPSRSARRSSVPIPDSDPVSASISVPDSVSVPIPDTAHLLQIAIEQLCDGLVVITTEGQVIAANRAAYQICAHCCAHCCAHRIADSAEAAMTSALQLPVSIWQQCQQLIQQGELQSDQLKVLEFELMLADATHLRVRLRWLEAAFVAPEQQFPLLLITLEERNCSLAKLYQNNLSDREKEVWQLRVQGYSYQEIANKLYITINTVKKHVKNIRAKQRLFEAPD